MEKNPREFKKHLFICTNVKEKGECCGAKDSKALLKKLKHKLKENNQSKDYRVSGSSCLGPCSRGISAVVFPENIELTKLSINSVDELYSLLIDDQEA